VSTDVVTVVRFLFGAAATLAWPVMAQEVLPRPEPPFKGVIGETYKDSTPDKIPLIKAPDGAPSGAWPSGSRDNRVLPIHALHEEWGTVGHRRRGYSMSNGGSSSRGLGLRRGRCWRGRSRATACGVSAY